MGCGPLGVRWTMGLADAEPLIAIAAAESHLVLALVTARSSATYSGNADARAVRPAALSPPGSIDVKKRQLRRSSTTRVALELRVLGETQDGEFAEAQRDQRDDTARRTGVKGSSSEMYDDEDTGSMQAAILLWRRFSSGGTRPWR